MENSNLYNDILTKLEEMVSNVSAKSEEALKDIEIEIEDLNKIYKDMSTYIEYISKNKLGLKATTDMYANLISLKKLILDAKDKKHKISENDVKLLKSLYETVSKIKTNDDKSDVKGIDPVELISNIFKKGE